MVHTFHVTRRTSYLIALSFATVYGNASQRSPARLPILDVEEGTTSDPFFSTYGREGNSYDNDPAYPWQRPDSTLHVDSGNGEHALETSTASTAGIQTQSTRGSCYRPGVQVAYSLTTQRPKLWIWLSGVIANVQLSRATGRTPEQQLGRWFAAADSRSTQTSSTARHWRFATERLLDVQHRGRDAAAKRTPSDRRPCCVALHGHADAVRSGSPHCSLPQTCRPHPILIQLLGR